MNKKTKKLKGISLIVLVITILVLSILAATVIISLNNTNIIGETNKAVLKSNIQSLQDRVTSYTANNYISIDMKKEYTLSEYGITEEEFKKYQTIAVVKGGKIYIKPNASSDILEVARELNVLLDATFSNTGSLELASTNVKSLKIYGNSIQNGTPSESTPVEIQSVGEKSKNLLDIDCMLNEYLIKNDDDSYTIQKTSTGRFSNILQVDIPANTYISLSAEILEYNGTYNLPIQFSLRLEDDTTTTLGIANDRVATMQYTKAIKEIRIYQEGDMPVGTYAKFKNLQLEIGNEKSSYEPYGYKIPVKISGKNLFDVDDFISTFNQFNQMDIKLLKQNLMDMNVLKILALLRKMG